MVKIYKITVDSTLVASITSSNFFVLRHWLRPKKFWNFPFNLRMFWLLRFFFISAFVLGLFAQFKSTTHKSRQINSSFVNLTLYLDLFLQKWLILTNTFFLYQNYTFNGSKTIRLIIIIEEGWEKKAAERFGKLKSTNYKIVKKLIGFSN